MTIDSKSENAYKTIGEVARELGLVNKKTAIYKPIPLDIGKHNSNR